MNRTLTSFLFDEARLLLLPFFMDNVLTSPPEDPLVYDLFPIFWAFAVVIGLLEWFPRFAHASQIILLQDLAKIHPEDRNEFIRKRCRIYNVQLKFVEDLEDKYEYEFQDEKDVLIEVGIVGGRLRATMKSLGKTLNSRENGSRKWIVHNKGCFVSARESLFHRLEVFRGLLQYLLSNGQVCSCALG
jgi:hypothetical protein